MAETCSIILLSKSDSKDKDALPFRESNLNQYNRGWEMDIYCFRKNQFSTREEIRIVRNVPINLLKIKQQEEMKPMIGRSEK
ncbi:uncharacterized protein V1477_009387 [Vespula maculifrons]|uniref:Uncharacterized protein n=1 Tax=Vespula maculifrons TaxID=7453 RepID=A0ABD2C9L9_VESMC